MLLMSTTLKRALVSLASIAPGKFTGHERSISSAGGGILIQVTTNSYLMHAPAYPYLLTIWYPFGDPDKRLQYFADVFTVLEREGRVISGKAYMQKEDQHYVSELMFG